MELWVLLPIAAVAVVLLLLMRNEVVRRLLACPVKHAEAEVRVVQRYREPSKPVRIKSCSLLEDPERIDCSQACIRQPA